MDLIEILIVFGILYFRTEQQIALQRIKANWTDQVNCDYIHGKFMASEASLKYSWIPQNDQAVSVMLVSVNAWIVFITWSHGSMKEKLYLILYLTIDNINRPLCVLVEILDTRHCGEEKVNPVQIFTYSVNIDRKTLTKRCWIYSPIPFIKQQ